MAFPATLPAQGTTHLEDGQLFQVAGGKWKKRPPTVCLNASHPGGFGTNLVLVAGDESFRAINRISIDVAFVPSADTHVQVNFRRHSNVWMSPFNDYTRANGALHIGGSRWRDNTWAMGHEGKGYYLSWNKDAAHKLRRDFCHWLRLDLVAISDTQSLMSWNIMHRNVANEPCYVRGSALVSEHPKNLNELAFNANESMWQTTFNGELA